MEMYLKAWRDEMSAGEERPHGDDEATFILLKQLQNFPNLWWLLYEDKRPVPSSAREWIDAVRKGDAELQLFFDGLDLPKEEQGVGEKKKK